MGEVAGAQDRDALAPGPPGDLGSGGRPGSAPDGGGEQQPEAAHLGALAQPPGTVLPAGKPLPLEPPASECGVLAGDRERGPVDARAAGAPEQQGAVAHATDPDT